jgi:hypothetical protein
LQHAIRLAGLCAYASLKIRITFGKAIGMAILQEKVGMTNEELRKIKSMRPGRSVDLQLMTQTGAKRVRSEFVGMDSKRCLILKFPDEGKWGRLRDTIFKDASLIVRYILEDDTGEIIAFKVKVLLVATMPSDLIFTTFPLAIQSHDLRSEPRAQTSIPIILKSVEDNQNICSATVVDISTKGCRVSVDKKLLKTKPELKSTIGLAFVSAGQSNIDLLATLLSAKSDEVNLYYGMKFETSQLEVKKVLRDMMVIAS